MHPDILLDLARSETADRHRDGAIQGLAAAARRERSRLRVGRFSRRVFTFHPTPARLTARRRLA